MNIDEYLKDFTEQEKEDWWSNYNNQHTIYEQYMAQYVLDHECCPNCGETSHSSTYVGFLFNTDQPESYKDLNKAGCKCGHKHTIHDRVPRN
jgi:RNA polymerase subunit RPABC4/transcription elongation factor Spt4